MEYFTFINNQKYLLRCWRLHLACNYWLESIEYSLDKTVRSVQRFARFDNELTLKLINENSDVIQIKERLQCIIADMHKFCLSKFLKLDGISQIFICNTQANKIKRYEKLIAQSLKVKPDKFDKLYQLKIINHREHVFLHNLDIITQWCNILNSCAVHRHHLTWKLSKGLFQVHCDIDVDDIPRDRTYRKANANVLDDCIEQRQHDIYLSQLIEYD